MRGIRTILLALMVWGLAAQGALAADSAATPAPATFDSLAKWNGHYPTLDGKTFRPFPAGQTLWDDPRILGMMKKNLPTEIIRKITKGWTGNGDTTEVPVQMKGKTLFVSVCRPHFCSGDSALLFFNLEKQTVQLCWSERGGQTRKQVDYWIDTKVRRLPLNACRAYEDFALFEQFGDKNY